jgi:transposase-like protein
MKKNRIAPDLKEQILNRVKNDGLTVSEVAKDHGIPESTIHTWIARKV